MGYLYIVIVLIIILIYLCSWKKKPRSRNSLNSAREIIDMLEGKDDSFEKYRKKKDGESDK